MNDIRCDVLKVFYSEIMSDERWFELRLVRWTVNGERSQPMFEKREYLTKKNGEKTNRCVGLKAADIYRLLMFTPELADLMGFPIREEVVNGLYRILDANDKKLVQRT